MSTHFNKKVKVNSYIAQYLVIGNAESTLRLASVGDLSSPTASQHLFNRWLRMHVLFRYPNAKSRIGARDISHTNPCII